MSSPRAGAVVPRRGVRLPAQAVASPLWDAGEEREDEEEDRGEAGEDFRTGTVLKLTFSLANTILGAGILGLPAAFSLCGRMLGTGLLLSFGAASGFGLHLLSCCAMLGGKHMVAAGAKSSFRSVATLAAPRFATVIDAAVAVKCFGVATSYLIVVGDTMPDVASDLLGLGPDSSALIAQRHPWIVGFAALVTPLAFTKKLSGIWFASMFSLVCVGFLCFVTLWFFLNPPSCHGDHHGHGHHHHQSDDDCARPPRTRDVAFSFDAARNLPIFIFSFTCHQNIFTVVNELKRPTRGRVDGVIACSIGVALLVYLTVANLGYATFGDHVLPDVLDNYPAASPMVALARVFIAVLVGLCYPLQCHPARACLRSLLAEIRPPTTDGLLFEVLDTDERQRTRGGGGDDDDDGDQEDGDDDDREEERGGADNREEQEGSSRRRGLASSVSAAQVADRRREATEHIAITALFVGASFLIALSVTSLGKVLAVVGATGSTTVSYILPGGIYYRLGPRGIKRDLALIQFCAGCVIIPTALAFIFVSKDAAAA